MGERINGTDRRQDSLLRMGNENEISIRSASTPRLERQRSDQYAPTPTSMTVRCLLFYAASLGLEVSTSDVRVAFMHAVASEPKFAKPPVEQRVAEWLWLVKKAMNGMRTVSKAFGDLVPDVMKEIQVGRGKQIHRSTRHQPQAAIIFHVDDPIPAASHQQTSAAPHPGIRNPIVVYLMSCTQRVSPFYRMAHASST